MNKLKRSDLSIEPCGTSTITSFKVQNVLLILTPYFLFFR